MRHALFGVLAAMLVAAGSGCVGRSKWRYSPAPVTAKVKALPYRVAVLPAADNRPAGFSGRSGWAMVPFLPFATGVVHRPEDYLDCWKDFDRRIQEALYEEIRGFNLFAEVRRADDPEEAKRFDLSVRPVIVRTDLWRRQFTYCLGFSGTVFWLLGAPAWHEREFLEIEVHLYDETRDRPMARVTIENLRSELTGIYYGTPSDPGRDFPQLLGARMPDFLRELSDAAREEP